MLGRQHLANGLLALGICVCGWACVTQTLCPLISDREPLSLAQMFASVQ